MEYIHNSTKHLYFIKKGDTMGSDKGQYYNNDKKAGDFMPTIIRQIIEQEESGNRDYSNYQKERLLYLKNLKNLSPEEQESERQRIIEKLKRIGIMNDDGEISEFYRYGTDSGE